MVLHVTGVIPSISVVMSESLPVRHTVKLRVTGAHTVIHIRDVEAFTIAFDSSLRVTGRKS